MIQLLKETQEMFAETDEEVATILETAENDKNRELIGKEIKKRVKKFKDNAGDKCEVEYFHIKLTYQNSTLNDIIENYYM